APDHGALRFCPGLIRPLLTSSHNDRTPDPRMTSYNNPAKSLDGTPSAGDYEALAMFRLTLRRFNAFSESAALQAGLKPQQHQALLAIKALSATAPPSVGDVADQLLIRHHSAVELINR